MNRNLGKFVVKESGKFAVPGYREGDVLLVDFERKELTPGALVIGGGARQGFPGFYRVVEDGGQVVLSNGTPGVRKIRKNPQILGTVIDLVHRERAHL